MIRGLICVFGVLSVGSLIACSPPYIGTFSGTISAQSNVVPAPTLAALGESAETSVSISDTSGLVARITAAAIDIEGDRVGGAFLDDHQFVDPNSSSFFESIGGARVTGQDCLSNGGPRDADGGCDSEVLDYRLFSSVGDQLEVELTFFLFDELGENSAVYFGFLDRDAD